MKVRNSGRWAPCGPKRWAIALVALLSAAFIRTLLHPVLGAVMPGTAFLIAAVLVQYYGGLGPACCVMFAGLCIADYLFVPPYGHIEVIDQSDIVSRLLSAGDDRPHYARRAAAKGAISRGIAWRSVSVAL